MNIIIRQLRKKDFDTARKYAIDGMHQTWYTNNSLELYLYSKYFWYYQIVRATRALGAYMDNKLVGVLLVDMNNQPKVFHSIRHKLFVRFVSFIIKSVYKNASSSYDNTNRELFEEYSKNHKLDGELIFFVVDPTIKGKGIGTLLLKELERQEKGKRIYLYTDTGSTYQFYSHRGFEESGRRDIILDMNSKEIPLTCFLFSKIL